MESIDNISEVDTSRGEIVQTWGMWTFFRKKGKFELYSDNESKIKEYSKIQKTFLLLGLAEALIMSSQINLYLNSRMVAALISTTLLSIISITLFYQAYKCRRKIVNLKNEYYK